MEPVFWRLRCSTSARRTGSRGSGFSIRMGSTWYNPRQLRHPVHMGLRIPIAMLIFCGLPIAAQTETRRATMRDSRGDRGKCTIDIVVDNAAEVEIRGD